MKTAKKLTLTDAQRSELEKEYRFGSSHRFRMRCKAILMKADGSKVEEIAKFVECNKLSVYRWIRKYNEQGIDGLREKGGRGPKPLMDLTDTEAVRAAVEKYRTSIKTAKAEWQKMSGKKVSEVTFKRFLGLLVHDISA